MFDLYPDILTVEQLCEIFQIGKNTAYELLNSGQLKAIKLGNVWKIPKQNLIDFIIVKNRKENMDNIFKGDYYA